MLFYNTVYVRQLQAGPFAPQSEAEAVVVAAVRELCEVDLLLGDASRARTILGWKPRVTFTGLVGMILHLESTFFRAQSLHELVYTAPFAAPLSFAGLGFLVLVNRMVPRGSREWAQWVLFLAWGGFVGNLALSLADHAQNGFFDGKEWVPVFAAAISVGFLLMTLLQPRDRLLLRATRWVLAAQIVVGLLGFVLHLRADLRAPGPGLVQSVLFGAPPFAPLLFADLAVLAALALWDLEAKAVLE